MLKTDSLNNLANLVKNTSGNTSQNSSDNFFKTIKNDLSFDKSGNLSSDLLNNSSKYIKVICRVRPLSIKETQINNEKTISISPDNNDSLMFKNKIYKFDQVISETQSQLYLYETVAKPIINHVLNGFNNTIFAYGQTSSGKTFTMEGVLGNDELEGIIPRISRGIFDHITLQKNNSKFIIKVSSFQLYMENIQDMLDESKGNLSIHEDGKKDFFIKNLTNREVYSSEDLLNEFKKGQANRRTCSTNMNEMSSRSHSIFQIEIRQENDETGIVLNGKLFLVDLAGSETISKTKAEGIVMREACEINKSLFELQKVIKSISYNKKEPFIYRNSKLTKILKESLGGNSLTTMIICCSPSTYNENETKSTLKFGSITKKIKNLVTINKDLTIEKWKQKHKDNQLKIGDLEMKISKALSQQQDSKKLQLNKQSEESMATNRSCSDKEKASNYRKIVEKLLKNIDEIYNLYDNTKTSQTLEKSTEDVNKLFYESLNRLKDEIRSKKKFHCTDSENNKNEETKNNQLELINKSRLLENTSDNLKQRRINLLDQKRVGEDIIRELMINKEKIQCDELKKKIEDLKLKGAIKVSELEEWVEILKRQNCEKDNEIKRKLMNNKEYSERYSIIKQNYIKKLTNIKNLCIFIQSINLTQSTNVKELIDHYLEKLEKHCKYGKIEHKK